MRDEVFEGSINVLKQVLKLFVYFISGYVYLIRSGWISIVTFTFHIDVKGCFTFWSSEYLLEQQRVFSKTNFQHENDIQSIFSVGDDGLCLHAHSPDGLSENALCTKTLWKQTKFLWCWKYKYQNQYYGHEDQGHRYVAHQD